MDEDGNQATGGLHCTNTRPGGGVDAAALGWQQRYTIDDIAHEFMSCGHNIVKSVFVECGSMYKCDGPAELQCVGETEFVNGIAAMSASGAYGAARICAGIVATVDMELGAAIEPVILAHKAASPRLRGIRAPIHCPPTPAFSAAIAILREHNLSFELGVGCDQLGDAIQIAQAFPDVTMILNHCGECAGPASFDGHPEVQAKWEADISTLGKLQNVIAKVGGCTMTFNGWGLEARETPIGSHELAELTAPIYGHVIRSFGANKSMFESNFPVDKVCISYRVLWNAYKRLVETMGLSEEERHALFYGTANAVYRLE